MFHTSTRYYYRLPTDGSMDANLHRRHRCHQYWKIVSLYRIVICHPLMHFERFPNTGDTSGKIALGYRASKFKYEFGPPYPKVGVAVRQRNRPVPPHHQRAHISGTLPTPKCTRFGGTYNKIGTIQRRLAWPLRKDDTQIREAFHIF